MESINSTGMSRDAAPLAVKPKRACQMLDCGITRLYQLLASGALQSFKDGASRKITVDSIERYIAKRLAEASGTPAVSPVTRRRSRMAARAET